ncbi:hypothetical protein TraAM80_09465 [Trypanosoma rangeli]|uniref:Uncharacterized protein n=1 Tax=Trypanosoma rangeli TaxID=5698 RepID=A0A422MVJ6_TRYRA|nr:uncharacterized protein TraAM80_09465 [Trypanosoma rangeli]RNE97227.1 hypothetical protein TraAM80_09465 [Trypanosoma rangeli]|eukprot:RNE97227.1 hypothetical protein TraAM80_09465 [Trypanosoma rangeli]
MESVPAGAGLRPRSCGAASTARHTSASRSNAAPPRQRILHRAGSELSRAPSASSPACAQVFSQCSPRRGAVLLSLRRRGRPRPCRARGSTGYRRGHVGPTPRPGASAQASCPLPHHNGRMSGRAHEFHPSRTRRRSRIGSFVSGGFARMRAAATRSLACHRDATHRWGARSHRLWRGLEPETARRLAAAPSQPRTFPGGLLLGVVGAGFRRGKDLCLRTSIPPVEGRNAGPEAKGGTLPL